MSPSTVKAPNTRYMVVIDSLPVCISPKETLGVPSGSKSTVIIEGKKAWSIIQTKSSRTSHSINHPKHQAIFWVSILDHSVKDLLQNIQISVEPGSPVVSNVRWAGLPLEPSMIHQSPPGY